MRCGFAQRAIAVPYGGASPEFGAPSGATPVGGETGAAVRVSLRRY